MACDVFRLFRSARPRPVFSLANQAGAHWIPLNVVKNLVEFFLVTHPAVVRFALPEGFAASAQYPIGLAGAGALQSTHDFRRLLMRPQQQMNMVRHDDPGGEAEESPLFAAGEEGTFYYRSYLRIFQPDRAGRRPIHLSIERHEALPFGLRRVHEKLRMARLRPMQPPGDE